MPRLDENFLRPKGKDNSPHKVQVSVFDRLRLARFAYDIPYILFDRMQAVLGRLTGHNTIRSGYDNERTPPFFIVGSGRSGNTLLRAILMGHESIVIPPESYVLGKLVREYRTQRHFPWPRLLRHVLSTFVFHPEFGTWELELGPVYRKCRRWPEEKRSLAGVVNAVYVAYCNKHFPAASRWGDKTPVNAYHLPRIARLFPNAQYIHVLRDGRDVVSSYMESGLQDEVEAACRRWLDSVFLVQRFGRHLPPERFLEVRYERLVRDPDKVIRSVCDYLDLEYEPSMLRHQDVVDDLGDSRMQHHVGLRRPITDETVGKWRERLSPQDRKDVDRLLGQEVRQLGYS